MFRNQDIAAMGRAAAEKVGVGNPANVLAVVNASGSLSVATLGGTIQIKAVARRQPGVETDVFDLVIRHGEHSDTVATGSMFEIEAMREVMAARLMRRVQKRCSFRVVPLMAASAIVAFGAGIFVGTPSMPPAAKPASGLTAPAFPAAAGPSATNGASVGDAQADAIELARRLREAMAIAKPGTPGAISHPDQPVSLDAPDAAVPAPAARPQPVMPPPMSTPVPHAAAVPQTKAPDQQAAAPTPPQPAPQAAAPDSAAVAAGPRATAAPASVQASQEAQKLLASLQDLKTKLSNGEQLTPEMLASLPPDVAARLKTSMTAQAPALRPFQTKGDDRLTNDEMTKVKTDQYGIPDVPEANTWAASGGRIPVALPGGGDIQSQADMARFGLQP